MRKATAYIDGSGNSGRIQACAVVMRVVYLPGTEAAPIKYERTKLLPRYTSNNVGEYNGLLLALSLAAELQVDDLQVYSDSKLIVYQVQGLWKCTNEFLIPLRDRARYIAKVFRKVSIDWVPREQNKEADSLCRLAIKAAEKSPNNPFMRV